MKVVNMVSMVSMVALTVYMTCPAAFAANTEYAKQIIDGTLRVVYLITNMLGIMFAMIGFVKLVIAHSETNGPDQKSALLWIAVGVALIMLRFVLTTINFSGWIYTNFAGGD